MGCIYLIYTDIALSCRVTVLKYITLIIPISFIMDERASDSI